MTPAPTVRDISNSVYREFAIRMHRRVIDNPVCEVCKQHPSVRINRWGTIRACCTNCLNDELQRYHADMEEAFANREESLD